MRRSHLASAALALLLAACNTNPDNVPPPEALNRTCGPGGGHGPTGVMDWHCVDGDGVERLRPQPLTRVIRGDPLPADQDED